MNDPENQFSSSFSREQEEQASQWVARHERGLSEEEMRTFDQWLSEDPSNDACFFEQQVVWGGFDVMDDWKPSFSSPPNPDLFENKQKRIWSRFLPYGGLAAAILLGLFFVQVTLKKTNDSETFVGTTFESLNNEKHFLEDGTSFYLLPNSKIFVAYSETERSIKFVRGEAHFSVAHDPKRPFVVRSDVGSVTAVGTSFLVRQDSSSWEVFVTEGKVKVNEADNDPTGAQDTEVFSAELSAGQKMVQELSEKKFSPKVEVYTATELKQRLAWKDQIIDMVSAPLEEIIFEFSRFNHREVIIVDEALKRMRMSVAIKPDNLEDFIDLLELSAGMKASNTQSGSILLSRSSD